jgi:hypothetical protein
MEHSCCKLSSAAILVLHSLQLAENDKEMPEAP